MQIAHPGLKAVVVGDGPVRESLANQYKDVLFVGLKKGEELAAHYASADILLFPSETETFGNVLLEGLASGLVTVSYAYAASSIYIQNERNGLHAEVGDEETFMEHAMRSIDLYKNAEFRSESVETVKSQSWDKVTANFEKHFEEMIQQQPVTQRRVRQ